MRGVSCWQVDDKYCVWQFNFRDFNLQDDLYAQDSIELLKQSGIDFQVLQDQGIDPVLFGELLMSSGIVLNDEVRRPISRGAPRSRGHSRDGGAGAMAKGEAHLAIGSVPTAMPQVVEPAVSGGRR